ncbi:MAG TPA: cupin domain-containing protein [Ignavibacteria bacterium]|nr:cupin domain-containing protein [Ignavibacteria bacterium]
MEKVDFYIKKFGLEKHPEGGYFKETYRSGEIIQKDFLPVRYSGARTFSTLIYFLLQGEQISYFHKLKSDEIWHFYDGSSLTIYLIKNEYEIIEIILGNDVQNNESFQAIIPKDNWFAAEVMNKNSYSLVGCTVAPGFDFKDFELSKRKELLKTYPNHLGIINKFTHI